MSKATVYVTVSGLTGSGKSAVMGEIEIALKALGIPVEHDAEFQSEKNMTHADWQDALDLYKPTVVLKEVNDTSAPQSFTVTDQMVEKACAVLTTAGLKTSPLQIKKIRRALEAALSPSTPS